MKYLEVEQMQTTQPANGIGEQVSLCKWILKI